jgi:hypothetical protein
VIGTGCIGSYKSNYHANGNKQNNTNKIQNKNKINEKYLTTKFFINRKETKRLRHHLAVLGIEEWTMIVSFVSYRQSETMVLR